MTAGAVSGALTLGAMAGLTARAATRPDGSATVLETGVASWYGPQHHGRKTSNGERFNQDGLTAAHPNLPFGSMVKVTLLATGRSVVVRVHDRFPRYRGRVIDLSRAAAREIGMMRRGTGRVRVEVVG